MPYSHNDVRDTLGFVSPPLGLGYIASYLQEKGSHSVRIHDGMLHQTTDAELVDALYISSPSIVGISAQATPAIYDVYRTASLVKQFDPDCQVVVGGAHATYSDHSILKDCPDIDFVVRGEGELVMHDLISSLEDGKIEDVRGITYRDGLRSTRTPRPPPISNLDDLPFPAYNLMDYEKYFVEGIRVGTMISSRGCPYSCTFCSSSRSSGKKWRGRSAENVVEELTHLIQRYGIKELEFLDDLFCYDPDRVRKITELMRTRDIEIGWTCSVRADILSKNPQMASWLKNAGCHTIYMGVESGSQRILNKMRKGTTLEEVARSNYIAKKAGLQRLFSFIIGYPEETYTEARSTIDIACSLDPEYAQFTICTPYPGTPLHERATQNGWLKAKSWSDYSVLGSVMELPTLSSNQIKRLMYRSYLAFYLRPSYLWRQLKHGNFFFFKKTFQGLHRYLKKGSTSKLRSQGEKGHKKSQKITLFLPALGYLQGFEVCNPLH
jgi:radical SAM superfamily enzyme YgiQ (UPF0313 family)